MGWITDFLFGKGSLLMKTKNQKKDLFDELIDHHNTDHDVFSQKLKELQPKYREQFFKHLSEKLKAQIGEFKISNGGK